MSKESDLLGIDATTKTLAELKEQAAAARAELAGLRIDLVDLHRDISGMRTAQIVGANEKLVMAALRDKMMSAELDPRLHDLREANEQLVLSALTAQKIEADVDEAHRRQIKFLAMVAHELRNPLTPIRTAAELLTRARADDSLLPRLQLIIKRQVAHMTRLVDDLLDGSRIATGKFRLERSVVELDAVLTVALEACRPAMDARLQLFSMESPPDPLLVNADPARLAQVFSNLLDNASKYTPEGGEITMVVTTRGRELAVTVADTGIGITAAALPNIFELFVQDERALALHNRGLGIGLAVVRELVEAHGEIGRAHV